MKQSQRDAAGVILLIWLAFIVGWILNIVQIFKQMPATLAGFADMAPMYFAKIICVFIAPIGSILGYVGLF